MSGVSSAPSTLDRRQSDTIVAQLQGGLIFGLTAALYGEITIEKGRVRQSNFNNYRMLRINQTPAIEVHLIESGELPGGIGETGTTAAPPAVCNAHLCCDWNKIAQNFRSTATSWREGTGMTSRTLLASAVSGALSPLSQLSYWWSPAGCFSSPAQWISQAGGALLWLLIPERIHGCTFELSQADLITRGQYLAVAADCAACHTAERGKPFAGGLASIFLSERLFPQHHSGQGNGNW